MLFGDKPAFDIAATSCFRTPLFTLEIGQSPMWGLIHFLRVRSHQVGRGFGGSLIQLPTSKQEQEAQMQTARSASQREVVVAAK